MNKTSWSIMQVNKTKEIIGAGAVVKGDIPDYAIVVGNPAKIIGDTRDEKFKLVTND